MNSAVHRLLFFDRIPGRADGGYCSVEGRRRLSWEGELLHGLPGAVGLAVCPSVDGLVFAVGRNNFV